MFTTAVAWIAFVFGSLMILWAIIDTIFQFSASPLAQALKIRTHYFTGAMAFIVVAWFLSGWFLFG
jgi:hypothetical protein